MTDEAKTELYSSYYSKVHRYIQGKVNNSVLADDLCSDVFLKVYEKIDSFDDRKASLSTWIFTITRNTLTDYYRTRRVYEEIPETLESGDSIEEDICRREQLEQLASALEHLGENERNIIILHYYSGMKLKDVADRLGLSYSYARALHGTALKHLKNYI